MKQKTLSVFLLIASAVAMSIFAMNPFPPDRTERQKPKMSEEFIERSENYIQNFGGRPLAELSLEQKLLLLHSYYNVEDFTSAARVGEAVTPELSTLPPERQQVFGEMIQAAIQQSH